MALANQQAKRDVIVSKDALLKSYKKRLKVRLLIVLNLIKFINNLIQDDVKGMADNFSEIVKLCRVEDENQVSEGLTFTLRPRITDLTIYKTGEQSDAGGGGQPRDAGAGLQHGQSGGEPHEAGLRPQDLSHSQ